MVKTYNNGIKQAWNIQKLQIPETRINMYNLFEYVKDVLPN